MRHNLTDILNIIKDRRTIYPEQFSSRKVHKEQVEVLLEAANWAPTHGMTEPWRFKIFSKGAQSNFLKFCAESYKNWAGEEKFLQSKYDVFAKRDVKTSFVIAVYMKRQESQKISELDEIMAVASSIQNMHLAATAYGLGFFWSTPKFMLLPEFNQYLNIGESDKCLGIIYIGYPEIDWPKSKRGIIYNKTEWID
jgi:nitroreductase